MFIGKLYTSDISTVCRDGVVLHHYALSAECSTLANLVFGITYSEHSMKSFNFFICICICAVHTFSYTYHYNFEVG